MGRRGPLALLDVPLGPRVIVGGISGSGKTTLARELARRIGGTHVEMDAHQHRAGWTLATDEEFRASFAAALDAAGDRWVVDGNYTRMRDVAWPRATTFVWLDYPFGLATWRVLKRTVRRSRTREPLWHGNVEEWRNVLDRGHPIWWSMTHFRANRRGYVEAVADPRWAHLDVVRIRRPRDLREWLASVARS